MAMDQDLCSTQGEFSEEGTQESQTNIWDTQDATEASMQPPSKKPKVEAGQEEEQTPKDVVAELTGCEKNPDISALWAVVRLFVKMTRSNAALAEGILGFAMAAEKQESPQQLEHMRQELITMMDFQILMSKEDSLTGALQQIYCIILDYGKNKRL